MITSSSSAYLTFSSSARAVFGVGVAEGALLVDGVPVSVPGFRKPCPQDADRQKHGYAHDQAYVLMAFSFYTPFIILLGCP